MAFTEGPQRPHDRHSRRRPFTNWMKRLANLKSLHTDSTSSRPAHNNVVSKTKKGSFHKHTPYPMSSRSENGVPSMSTPVSSRRSQSLRSHSKNSMSISNDSQMQQKSRAPTLATTAETTTSDAGRSGAETTIPRTEGDRDSTFSSPAPSLRSMTTTLTTLQSTTPAANSLNQAATTHAQLAQTQPASAVPAHLAPHGHPTTYHHATANNVLTDDASVLTLASSSKRRRRNSLDTNASIKALAPASMFGGSRESLPLSVLSGTVIHSGQGGDNASIRDTASSHYPRSAFNAERASLISASGVTAPALTSERNSYISNKPTGDGASVRSGLLGHGSDRERSLYHARNDSLGGMSISKDRYRDRDLDRDGWSQRDTTPTSPNPT